MSLEGLLATLTEEILFDIIEGVATAAAAGIEHSEIKAVVRANIKDPALIPAELRRLRDSAIDQMGT
jgi:hypothetical protein